MQREAEKRLRIEPKKETMPSARLKDKALVVLDGMVQSLRSSLRCATEQLSFFIMILLPCEKNLQEVLRTR